MKKPKKIILINGKKRSGKDFTAKIFQKVITDFGYSCDIMSFADPIKEIISKTFGISLETLDNLKNDKAQIKISEEYYDAQSKGKTLNDFRVILQVFGTEAMKPVFGDNVWVELLKDKFSKSDSDFVLVPDFRFLCEHSEDSVTINIFDKNLPEDGDAHSSENELNDFVFDYYIDNTGHPDNSEKLKSIFSEIIKNDEDYKTDEVHFSSSKLIRDKYVNVIPHDQLFIEKNKDRQYMYLKNKIHEELSELSETDFSDISEWGDLHETLFSMMTFKGIEPLDVKHEQEQKFEKFGGFNDFIILKQ